MNIQIDYDLCTRCGLCIEVCGSKRIGEGDDGRPYKIIEAGCSDCGHCVAVCPVDAILNTRVDMSEYRKIVAPGITTDQFTNLVRNRRSIRNFKPEPLKQEHIDQILNVVRYIPTASNKQGLKYKFITDPEILQKIKDEMASKMDRISGMANMFPVKYFVKKKNRSSSRRLVDLYAKGYDTFLRGAPCLLVIYTEDKYFRITQWDAGIASNTIALTAQTMGIGTLMNGYFVILSNRFRSIRKLIQLSNKQTVLTAVCLGYPDIKYRKTVYRRPLDVTML